MKIEIGQVAPDFTLFNTEKQPVTLSSLRGRPVLLLFFPLAFSSVCTTELCSVRDNLQIYNNLNVEVLGISVDSLYALGQFKKAEGLNFTLLSDFNKEVSTAYGALYEQFGYGMRGVGKRAAFVIDAEGVVRYAEVLENAGLQPDFEAIRKGLQQMG